MPRRLRQLLRRLPFLLTTRTVSVAEARSPLTANDLSAGIGRRRLLRVRTHDLLNGAFYASPDSDESTSTAIIFVRKLPVISMRAIPADEHTCGICLDAYLTGDRLEQPIKLPCGHILGHECIAEWLSPEEDVQQNTCPLCRYELFPKDAVSPMSRDRPQSPRLQVRTPQHQREFEARVQSLLNIDPDFEVPDATRLENLPAEPLRLNRANELYNHFEQSNTEANYHFNTFFAEANAQIHSTRGNTLY